MYENYCKIRDKLGYKDADVAKATGITKSTFSDWKSGRSTPKQNKIQKIADYFGVSIDYLMTGKEKGENEPYYLDDEARLMAEEMAKNPNLHILFDAARTVSKEDLQFVIDMVNRLKKENE